MEVFQTSGDSPLPRFGHTVTVISNTKVILFGGATGDVGKYSITSDTFLLDLITKKWRKLEPIGTAPSQRAAHAAANVDSLQLVIYGGAVGGGILFKKLQILNVCNFSVFFLFKAVYLQTTSIY